MCSLRGDGKLENNGGAVAVESTSSVKKSKVRGSKIGESVEKRNMIFMAAPGLIFGPTSDRFFMKSREKIRELVTTFDHATRFYLACKFLRRNELDFEGKSKMECNYSNAEVCKLLGVGRCSINNFVSKLSKDQKLIDVMKNNRYLSPIENNPKRHENFYQTHALNYDNLKVGGCFLERE